jgi:hypothetical protein
MRGSALVALMVFATNDINLNISHGRREWWRMLEKQITFWARSCWLSK